MRHMKSIIKDNCLYMIASLIILILNLTCLSTFTSFQYNTTTPNYTFEYFKSNAKYGESVMLSLPELSSFNEETICYYDNLFGKNNWFIANELSILSTNILYDPHNSLEPYHFVASEDTYNQYEDIVWFDGLRFGNHGSYFYKSKETLNFSGAVLLNINDFINEENKDDYTFFDIALYINEDNCKQIYDGIIKIEETRWFDLLTVDNTRYSSSSGMMSFVQMNLIFLYPIFIISAIFLAQISMSHNERNILIKFRWTGHKYKSLKEEIVIYLFVVIIALAISSVLFIPLYNHFINEALYLNTTSYFICLTCLAVFMLGIYFVRARFILSDKNIIKGIREDD